VSDDKSDDLFEDLDKFFAPIQDVDWPEPSEEKQAQPPAAPSEPPAERWASSDEDTGILGEPLAGEPEARSEAEGEPEVLADDAETPGQEGLFSGAVPEADTGEGWPADEDADEDAAAEPVMYETEPDISVESFTTVPSAYVDLPGASGQTDEEANEIAPLEEVPDEPPTPQEVEAAAEHFAEAVREEASHEPVHEQEPEAGLGDLLGSPEEVEDEILGDLEEPAVPMRTVRVGHEGLGGPSWQEPTAVEIGTDHDRRGGERDVPAAFLTGIILAALAVGSIAIGAGAFAIVASVVVLWAQGELYLAMQKRHHQPATALGLVSGALVLSAGYFRGEAAMLSMVVLSVFATFLWYMAVPHVHRKDTVRNAALTIFGVVYVPLLAGYALAMLRFSGGASDGRGITLAVIGLTFVYDTAAFIVGSWWGSRSLASTISPKKSWEGAIGATLVVIAVSVGVVASSVPTLDTVGRSVGLAVVVAFFAPLGDLAESLLKRDMGLKDMGSILPGHGGVLDRIDSVLFVAPAAFLFLRLILI
jgi:phosphatidate cytidylyltransferase